MLKPYRYRTDVYINDKHVERRFTDVILLNEEEVENTAVIRATTFEEVWKLYQDRAWRWVLPGNTWCFKEGRRRIEFYDCLPFTHKWNMLEHKPNTWKEVRLECEPVEYTRFSIEDALKMEDVDRAIQYLKERGLTIPVEK